MAGSKIEVGGWNKPTNINSALDKMSELELIELIKTIVASYELK